jgi:hypothetical protein
MLVDASDGGDGKCHVGREERLDCEYGTGVR